ncbi:MAG: energy transducer TonB [Treponema sp.]|jgi:protein TonB|nr:energy transducer TonB [Treponema sp.]
MRNDAVRLVLAALIALFAHAFVFFGLGAPARGPVPVRTGTRPFRIAAYRGPEPALSPPVPPLGETDAVAAADTAEADGGTAAAETDKGTDAGTAETDGGADEYAGAHPASTPPRFSEAEIRRRLVYPPPARRAGIEGRVYLELWVDKEGLVQSAVILEETPPGQGFGRAAAQALEGLRGESARINGNAQAVRFRYPVEFVLRRRAATSNWR